jgi:hypothetical protein
VAGKEKQEVCATFFIKNPNGRGYLGGVSINEAIILK